MTMKKKPLIITTAVILALIAIAITLFLVFGKERVNVKIVELPKEVGEFKLGSRRLEYIETAEKMDEVLAWHYLSAEDEKVRRDEALNDLKKQSDIISEYDEEFFNNNLIFCATTYREYSGRLASIPDIEKNVHIFPKTPNW